MGVSKNRGGPPKVMVKILQKPYEQMDDLGGFQPPIFGNTHKVITIFREAKSTKVLSMFIFTPTWENYPI